MTREELLLRRLSGQHLLAPSDKQTVAHDLCGIQCQFMSAALYSLRLRADEKDEETAGEGLIKNWTLRGTVHLFPESDLQLYLTCKGGSLYKNLDFYEKTWWNQRPDWALTPKRQRELSEVILSAVDEHPQTRDALKAACRAVGMTDAEEKSLFDGWGGGIRELCERGFIHYAAKQEKLFVKTPAFTPMEETAAELELARRYFIHLGPATVHDAMYFFRATAGKVKSWLKALPVESTEVDGKTYYYIGERNLAGEIPKVRFLAGFDQLMLAYEKKESLFLSPENIRGIFNLTGIVHPPLLLSGKVVGRWKKTGGKLELTPFILLKKADQKLIADEAERMFTDIKKLEYQ